MNYYCYCARIQHRGSVGSNYTQTNMPQDMLVGNAVEASGAKNICAKKISKTAKIKIKKCRKQ